MLLQYSTANLFPPQTVMHTFPIFQKKPWGKDLGLKVQDHNHWRTFDSVWLKVSTSSHQWRLIHGMSNLPTLDMINKYIILSIRASTLGGCSLNLSTMNRVYASVGNEIALWILQAHIAMGSR